MKKIVTLSIIIIAMSLTATGIGVGGRQPVPHYSVPEVIATVGSAHWRLSLGHGRLPQTDNLLGIMSEEPGTIIKTIELTIMIGTLFGGIRVTWHPTGNDLAIAIPVGIHSINPIGYMRVGYTLQVWETPGINRRSGTRVNSLLDGMYMEGALLINRLIGLLIGGS